jgi:hypothetical protein
MSSGASVSDGGTRRRIRDDNVERVCRQQRGQLLGIVLPAHPVDGILAARRRMQQPVGNELRHGVRDADLQLQRPAVGRPRVVSISSRPIPKISSA